MSAIPPLRIVSWNIARRDAVWRVLLDGRYDLALLQEASFPPPDVASAVVVNAHSWRMGGADVGERAWCAAVVGLSDRVQVEQIATAAVDDAGWNEIPVSRTGSLSIARITDSATGGSFIAASMYGAWESPRFTGQSNPWIFADASVHRVISDLSSLIGAQRGTRILAAGDLNVLRGYGEGGSEYWRKRYDTIFARMEALGLPCIGPELPLGVAYSGALAEERPSDSRTVPTFRTRALDRTSATRQLDFVFASTELARHAAVRAIDGDDEWGPSDHCRVEIELVEPAVR
jgi:hypothetical protein